MKHLILILITSISLLNCSDDTHCDWELLTPISQSDETKEFLNGVFSDENTIMNNFETENLFFAITNNQELAEMHNSNTGLNIDFEKYLIIGGRFKTNSISNQISNQELYKCNSDSTFKYEITVKKCVDCWAAMGFLYYWNIYPATIDKNKISLSIKYITEI